MRCQSPELSSVVKSSRVSNGAADMTSLSNIAEANLTPARGVLRKEQSFAGHVGRRPGFFFFRGLTRLLPPLKGVGSRR